MVVHAACGGSTNLLLHTPAIAHAAGRKRMGIEDWNRVNRETPRIVDVLPNGPVGHPTSVLYAAGGVPEVMLHLRRMGLLDTSVLTVTGQTLGDNLDWWEGSERREQVRGYLREVTGVDPGQRDSETGQGEVTRSHEHRMLSVRQSRSRRIGHQEHGDRSDRRGRRRRVPQHRSSEGVPVQRGPRSRRSRAGTKTR